MTTSTAHGAFGGGVVEFSLGKLAPGKVKVVAQFGMSVAAGFIEGEGYQQYVEGSNRNLRKI